MTRIIQRLLFNPECWHCGAGLKGKQDFCFPCRKEIFRALGKDGFLLRYEGAVKGLLACLRGAAPHSAAGWCLSLLEREGLLEQWRKEGFNSVAIAPQNRRREESGLAILGGKVSEALQIPLLQPFEKAAGHSQHGRTVAGRMDAPCFMRIKGRAAGKILLLDDVYTTGTTLDMCAYLLRKAGASEVVAFSLARQMMPGLERKKGEAGEEGNEMDPFLLHLFV